mmetsp:Transcript_20042/g.37456  ORF Transcript_20042/g.37456 Transcript_20042/m.37456 type:complete len:131 (-) Transcript_20042:54-446(-)
MRIRQSTRDGARIDVQLPHGSAMEDASVDVVQEFPCVVQYRVVQGNGDGKSGSSHRTSTRTGTNTSTTSATIQNRIPLGEYIDCSQLSASISEARNMLTVKAPPLPPQELSKNTSMKPRSIPVTEHEYKN